MDYVSLRQHIDADPDAHGYSGMDDEQVAASLKTETKDRNVTAMTGTEVAQNIDATDWSGLTADEKNQIIGMCGWTTLNPWGVEADIFLSIFGGGSATILALNAARVETVTEAEYYGFAGVTAADVETARYIDIV